MLANYRRKYYYKNAHKLLLNKLVLKSMNKYVLYHLKVTCYSFSMSQ